MFWIMQVIAGPRQGNSYKIFAGLSLGRKNASINLDDAKDVIWAVGTRSDLKTGSYFFPGRTSDQLDPMMPPEVREKKGSFDYTRIIINACPPYKKDFPAVCVFGEEWREKIRKKWGDNLFSTRS